LNSSLLTLETTSDDVEAIERQIARRALAFLTGRVDLSTVALSLNALSPGSTDRSVKGVSPNGQYTHRYTQSHTHTHTHTHTHCTGAEGSTPRGESPGTSVLFCWSNLAGYTCAVAA
jgi:hypothetical protein